MMKLWWQALALREKYLMLIGFVLAVITFFYRGIWLPLNNSTDQLFLNVTQSQELLEWMEPRVEKIKKLRTSSSSFKQDIAFLPQVQMSLRLSAANNFLTKISMGSEQTVNVTFDKVPFDTLISWLVLAQEKQGLQIKSISIHRLEEPGLVKVHLQLI